MKIKVVNQRLYLEPPETAEGRGSIYGQSSVSRKSGREL